MCVSNRVHCHDCCGLYYTDFDIVVEVHVGMVVQVGLDYTGNLCVGFHVRTGIAALVDIGIAVVAGIGPDIDIAAGVVDPGIAVSVSVAVYIGVSDFVYVAVADVRAGVGSGTLILCVHEFVDGLEWTCSLDLLCRMK